jgi:hypothetical protein
MVTVLQDGWWRNCHSVPGWGKKLYYPPQPSMQCVPEFLSPWIKQARYDSDHSLWFSAEVKNSWSYIPIPPYVFIVWCLYKHGDNFVSFRYTYCPNKSGLDGISVHEICGHRNGLRFNIIPHFSTWSFKWPLAKRSSPHPENSVVFIWVMCSTHHSFDLSTIIISCELYKSSNFWLWRVLHFYIVHLS